MQMYNSTNCLTHGKVLKSGFFAKQINKEYSVTTTVNLASCKKYIRLLDNLRKISKEVYMYEKQIVPICHSIEDNRIRCIPRYLIPDILKPWMDKYKFYFSVNTRLMDKDTLVIDLSIWSLGSLKSKKPYIFKYLHNFIVSYLSYLMTDKTIKFEKFLRQYNFLEHKCYKKFLQKTIII